MTYLIALDDGHGMKTNGKRTPYIEEFGRFIHENEFNREVVRIMDKELRRLGFKTLLVAPTDYDTPLQERTDLANKMKADETSNLSANGSKNFPRFVTKLYFRA